MFRSPAIAVLLLAVAALAAPAEPHAAPACELERASPWIRRWLSAWELTSREILRIPDAEPPAIVLFDSLCVYTTSEVAAPAGRRGRGPTLLGRPLPWRSQAHRDSITLPTGDRAPVQLMSFAGADRRKTPFFVMAGPSIWAQRGIGEEPGLTAVFLHEFAHTRQTGGIDGVIGPIDSTWNFPEALDDDVVQSRFERDSAYVRAYRSERDLLWRAAAVASLDESRLLARQALERMRERHARWFHGENAVFATLDDLWLSMEGAGQWVGYAWLAHERGGGLDSAAAVARMSGRRRRWSQDEGLWLFLVVDRLLPGWAGLVFGERSIGALDLLERATRGGPPPSGAGPERRR